MTKKTKISSKVPKKSGTRKSESFDLKTLFHKSAEKKFEFSKSSKRSFTKSIVANMKVG
jgi:hypothetical protein